jgi:arylsulfatase A-like enzyme
VSESSARSGHPAAPTPREAGGCSGPWRASHFARRALSLLLCLPTLAAVLVGCQSTRPPNLVLVIIDTLRADKLHSYGFPRPTSPELDALAQRGVRFARVIAPSPWTRPSIASLLTSLYPRSVGIYKEPRHILDERFATLPEVLREHGYKTLGATANPNINSSYNFHQGFDAYLDSHVLWAWMPAEKDKKRGYESPLWTSRQIFDALLEQVARDPARPTYLQACIMEVHGALGPGVVKPPFANRFAGRPDHGYLEAIAQVSFEIDRFIEELSALPGWDDTLFVITSDHGQGLFDHPDVAESQLHGRLLYESQTVVPLILYHPRSAASREPQGARLPPGSVIDRPVRLLDLAPTLLEFAGVPIPEEMEGVSLLPLLEGHDVDLPAVFVVETEYRDMNKIGAYAEKWNFIVSRDRHEGVSPRELQRAGRRENGSRTNLAQRFPRAASELAAFLERWEHAHPKARPTLQRGALSPEESEQLRALGYLP